LKIENFCLFMLERKESRKISNNILPMILVILDGWGIAKPNRGNAISLAKTPTMSGLVKKYPNTLLAASGKAVGLPSLRSGNSEAGHTNIGAGRVVEQDVVKISKSINDGTFFKNASFIEAIRHLEDNKSRLHLMGMISSGMSAHSDPDHLLALLSLAKTHNVKEVYLHLFTDGRDSPKYAALKLAGDLQKIFRNGEAIATIMGRYYAMDRKKTWARTEQAYDALTSGLGRKAASVQAAITESYNRGDDDEFIEPYVITERGKPLPRISNGDSVIFFNLRSDRARQISKVFVQKDFSRLNPGSFPRKKTPKDLLFVAMTDFGPDLDNILTAYPSVDLKQTLPLALKDLSQLYLAESEKYAHATYFFNGGYANPIAGERRQLIPSPDVRSYDETPTMSSKELTAAAVGNLTPRRSFGEARNWRYDFTVLNFAAPDMIGHTGNLAAGIKCCHEVDGYLGEIVKTYLSAGGTVLITADHGNIEEMINLKTGEIDTEHSTNPVPFILASDRLGNKIKLRSDGVLGDIAPTILELLAIKKPKEMTRKSLIKNS
jgi:2,3-bisphosphoglycerate-independent phosphoglycerate mutase